MKKQIIFFVDNLNLGYSILRERLRKKREKERGREREREK
jgi:hypothetical protein